MTLRIKGSYKRKIARRTWAIRFLKHGIEYEGMKVHGLCDLDAQEILIDATLDAHTRSVVLMHELLHVYESVYSDALYHPMLDQMASYLVELCGTYDNSAVVFEVMGGEILGREVSVASGAIEDVETDIMCEVGGTVYTVNADRHADETRSLEIKAVLLAFKRIFHYHADPDALPDWRINSLAHFLATEIFE